MFPVKPRWDASNIGVYAMHQYNYAMVKRSLKTVGLLVAPGMRSFDVAVAQEVFGADRTDRGVPACDFRLIGRGRAIALTQSVSVTVSHPLASIGECDLVLIPGSEDALAVADPVLIAALRSAYNSGATLASLCSGAFVLADTGLLSGREAVTHWRYCEELARRHPTIRVNPNILYAGGDRLWTSAGVTAGIDLCLQLARDGWGSAPAAAVARSMVTPVFRSGGQAQFIPPIRVKPAPESSMQAVQLAVLEDLRAAWTVAEMARLAAMSERTLVRRFTAEAGLSPAAWVNRQRVDAARGLLETADLTIEGIAGRVGFGSADLLRKHFAADLGVSPSTYRRSFRIGEGSSH
jgi:transcriptional regulator GlxA family with amidase domain